MTKNEKLPNRQVQRTCSWILEAILLLTDEMPYSKISVSDIVKKAGIARQTFYRNYKDKDEVILQYFSNVFANEMLNMENSAKNTINLTFNIQYMVKQQGNLKKMLSSPGILNLFKSRLNEWLDSLSKQYKNRLSQDNRQINHYKIIYQITGILDVIMDWFKNDMPIPVEQLLKLLNCLTVDTRAKYPNVPNIQIWIIAD
ncbi:MAG: TetR/AcrR family transcriptional regulator [Treponema sp.]|nr:TetR/AcrR family transcriptional regulator [Treponema sp.]